MFKVEVEVSGERGQWHGNGLTFETRAAAEAYARDLHSRWTAVEQWRVVELAETEASGVAGFARHALSVPIPERDKPRPLNAIAREIGADWKAPYFGAVPYLRAMACLSGIDDQYGADSAKSIVLYFLSNATTWRGETARRVKAELKSIARVK